MKNKKLLLIVISIILFVQCKKNCESFTAYPLNEKFKQYFDNYIVNQKIFFTSTKSGAIDTLKILSINTDTSKRVRDIDSCQWSLSKQISFRFKSLSPNNPIQFDFGSGEYMSHYIMDTTLKIRKDVIFSLEFDKKNNKIYPSSNTAVIIIDSLKIKNSIYKEVLKVNTLSPQMTVYFAPFKGLIRLENQIDTFNIQN